MSILQKHSKELGFPIYPDGFEYLFDRSSLHNIGIVVERLEHSQFMTDFIEGLNRFKQTELGGKTSINAFFEVPTLVNTPFPIFHVSEVMGFYGEIISTSVISTSLMLSMPNIKRVHHYMYDLEWLKPAQFKMSPESLFSVLTHPKVTLYCRGDEHAEAIRSSFNMEATPTFIDFDLSKLIPHVIGEAANKHV